MHPPPEYEPARIAVAGQMAAQSGDRQHRLLHGRTFGDRALGHSVKNFELLAGERFEASTRADLTRASSNEYQRFLTVTDSSKPVAVTSVLGGLFMSTIAGRRDASLILPDEIGSQHEAGLRPPPAKRRLFSPAPASARNARELHGSSKWCRST